MIIGTWFILKQIKKVPTPIMVFSFPSVIVINKLLIVNDLVTFSDGSDDPRSNIYGVFYQTLLLVFILNQTSFMITVFALPIVMVPLFYLELKERLKLHQGCKDSSDESN